MGHGADIVRGLLAGEQDIEFAVQSEQKGTGHAVMMCREHLAHHTGPVFVLAGDTPLLRSESLEGLLQDLSDQPGGLRHRDRGDRGERRAGPDRPRRLGRIRADRRAKRRQPRGAGDHRDQHRLLRV